MTKLQLLIILFLIIYGQQSFAQEKRTINAPKVDAKVELLSIVFQLAENKEYSAAIFKKYNDKLEAHFNPYKHHELVGFAKELRIRSKISYDAVVSMAIVLDDNLNPIIDFSKTVPDKRWSAEDAYKFVELLKIFYKDAKCNEFFAKNKKLFQEVERRFSAIYEKFDLAWYYSFYGTNEIENFTLLISPGCGVHNYGPSYTLPNNKKKAFAIMGIWKVDESGMPYFNENEYLPHIIHEFSHCFVNPLLEKHYSIFKESGEEIYKAVEYEMSRQQAYGNWQIMLKEALVRASVIKYFIDHGASTNEIKTMLNNDTNKGFIWIKGLVAELGKYESQRNSFPTLDSYITNLVNSYKTFSEKIKQFDAQKPKVKSISEFYNNDSCVDSQIKTITINFDRSLSGQGYSVNYGTKGKLAFPKLDNIYYSNGNSSIVMKVQLIPNKDYQFVLTGKNFKTNEGIGLKTYEVNFKTK